MNWVDAARLFGVERLTQLARLGRIVVRGGRVHLQASGPRG
jgi:hypothetical protein